MAEAQQPKPATAAEAAAMNAVYEKLADLLTAMRDARARVRHPELLAIVNEQIDRQLEADAQLREAIVEYTGQPVQDPY
ncbi:MAG: hypothetical protein ACRDI2_17100 [Chloroflexota bacterium]